nr:hypothetical protein B0A51_10468 [Rachicladosporium sp. CCFEE 5018]
MPQLRITSLYAFTVSPADVALCRQNAAYRKRIERIEEQIDKLVQERNEREKQSFGSAALIGEMAVIDLDAVDERITFIEGELEARDNELRKLGEALVAGPQFDIQGKVKLIDGKWYWLLPGQ